MKTSTFLSLNWKDALKGFLVAILTVIITGFISAIQAGTITFTWVFFDPLLLSGLGAGLAYLLKNFFSNSNSQVLTKEPLKLEE